MNYSEDRIAQLGKEIETVMNNLMTFRTRIGFTAMTGPFIIVGSVLIATGGKIQMPDLKEPELWIAAALCLITYVILGEYGGTLDAQMTEKCDEWREAIVEISQGREPPAKLLMFHHRNKPAYRWGFGLILVAVISAGFCISKVLQSETEAGTLPIKTSVTTTSAAAQAPTSQAPATQTPR